MRRVLPMRSKEPEVCRSSGQISGDSYPTAQYNVHTVGHVLMLGNDTKFGRFAQTRCFGTTAGALASRLVDGIGRRHVDMSEHQQEERNRAEPNERAIACPHCG